MQACPDAIRQITEAARSIKTLTDYLDRHPEALIRGKRPEKMNKVRNRLTADDWMCGRGHARRLSRSAETRIYGLDAAEPAARVDIYEAPALHVSTP